MSLSFMTFTDIVNISAQIFTWSCWSNLLAAFHIMFNMWDGKENLNWVCLSCTYMSSFAVTCIMAPTPSYHDVECAGKNTAFRHKHNAHTTFPKSGSATNMTKVTFFSSGDIAGSRSVYITNARFILAVHAGNRAYFSLPKIFVFVIAVWGRYDNFTCD